MQEVLIGKPTMAWGNLLCTCKFFPLRIFVIRKSLQLQHNKASPRGQITLCCKLAAAEFFKENTVLPPCKNINNLAIERMALARQN